MRRTTARRGYGNLASLAQDADYLCASERGITVAVQLAVLRREAACGGGDDSALITPEPIGSVIVTVAVATAAFTAFVIGAAMA